MQQILALSRCAVIARHWFEIDLDDASMEHGARIELRELVPQQHRGSESAAQIIVADRVDGKPLGKNGPFQLVVPDDQRPARWVHNLNAIAVRAAQ